MFEKILALVSGLYTKLTFRKTIFAILLMISTVACAIVWDTRKTITWYNRPINTTENREIPYPNQKTRTEVERIVDSNALVIGSEVISISFQTNERKTVYVYSEVPELQAAMDVFVASPAATSSLFLNNDPVNNNRLTSMMNGEFVCTPPYERLVKYVPIIPKFVATECAISIPPIYGSISGWVALWLARAPEPGELEDLRVLARNLSVAIYERNIAPVQTKVY